MLSKPTGPFASDGEIASKMEEWGNALQARIAELEHELEWIADLYSHEKTVGELATCCYEASTVARSMLKHCCPEGAHMPEKLDRPALECNACYPSASCPDDCRERNDIPSRRVQLPPKYLTVVLRLADNADQKLVFDQMDRINGATLSAAAWSHALDERNTYERALRVLAKLGNELYYGNGYGNAQRALGIDPSK